MLAIGKRKEIQVPVIWSVMGIALFLVALSLFTTAMGMAVSTIFSGHLIIGGLLALLALAIPWSLAGTFAGLAFSLMAAGVTCDRVSSLKRAYSRLLLSWDHLPLMKAGTYLSCNSDLAGLELCDGDYDRGLDRMRKVVERLNKNPFMRQSAFVRIMNYNLAATLLRLDYLDECDRVVEGSLSIAPAVYSRWSPQRLLWHRQISNWESFQYYSLKGGLALERGDYEVAVDLLGKGLEALQAPGFSFMILPVFKRLSMVSVLTSLVIARLELNQKAEAVSDTRQIIEILPTCYQSGYFLLGLKDLSRLSEKLIAHKEYESAEMILQYCYASARSSSYHPDSHLVIDAYLNLFSATERSDHLADLRSWVLPLAIEGH